MARVSIASISSWYNFSIQCSLLLFFFFPFLHLHLSPNWCSSRLPPSHNVTIMSLCIETSFVKLPLTEGLRRMSMRGLCIEPPLQIASSSSHNKDTAAVCPLMITSKHFKLVVFINVHLEALSAEFNVSVKLHSAPHSSAADKRTSIHFSSQWHEQFMADVEFGSGWLANATKRHITSTRIDRVDMAKPLRAPEIYSTFSCR